MILTCPDPHAIITDEKITNETPAIEIVLNYLSFGYANTKQQVFYVYYDPVHTFNFAKPELPQHYLTPRAVLPNIQISVEDYKPAPFMHTGYTSQDMRDYVTEDFPPNHKKLAWDFPCVIEKGIKYVHPGDNRYLTKEEVEALHGSPLDQIPPKIIEFFRTHLEWYKINAWEDKHFVSTYSKLSNTWHVIWPDNKLLSRVFDFKDYTPPWVCPESDRYPYVKF